MVKQLLMEKNLDNDTKVRTFSHGGHLSSEINCMGGRLVIVKNYPDTYAGKQEQEKFLESFQGRSDVENYFQLKGGLKNMSLVQVVEEVRKNKKFADEVVEGGNPATLSGRIARKKASAERVKQLYIQFKNELKMHAVFLVVTGSEAAKFAETSHEQANTTTVDSEEFYNDLANRVSPALYKNATKSHNVIDVLSRHFEDMAINMDILEYPAMHYNAKMDATIKNKEDLLKLTKKVINEQVGSEVAALYSYEKIARMAMAEEFDEGVLPVVFVTQTELAPEFIKGLRTITPKIFTVSAGENGYNGSAFAIPEVNAETVAATIKNVQLAIKGTTPQSNKQPTKTKTKTKTKGKQANVE